MSPNTVIGILNYKKQLDQDNAQRATEAASNMSEAKLGSSGTYGPLASAVSNNIQGDQVPVTPMANAPVAGGVAKTSLPATTFDGRNYPAMGVDPGQSEIQQYPELPSYPQLDNSNLAGIVPTNLTPPQSQPQPLTPNQPITSNEIDYYNPRHSDPNSTYQKTLRPDQTTYQNSTDANKKHIGPWGRFSAGAQKGIAGGPINALIGGVLGLANPGFGNRAAYERDLSRFDTEKQADQSQDAHDPRYQNQLQSEQLRMDQPVKLQTFKAQQEAEQQRQTSLENVKAANKKQQIDQAGKLALDKIDKQFGGKLFLQNKAAQDKASLETRQIAAGYAGNPAFEAMSDAEKGDFISDRWQEQRQAKLDKTVAEESRAEAQALLAKERAENPEKFRAPAKGPGGLTANYQMRLKLKPVEDEQRANQAMINVWRKKQAAGDITEDEFNQKVAPLNAQKEALAAKWAQAAAMEQSNNAGTSTGGKSHPMVGKTFTNPADGKKYTADEIDKDGNITKYH
jgi:hypothetical protein